ncbi:Cro/Cl family transcriptional regulator [Raoultella ornithinolytica]|uniref:Cro/Cl family transcriptional regulator n=1 Tax=Raoultella ornithinolytica TaxID=54291 RepID=UPI001A2F9153|nr:Cro/Cl family transcriptional regulator [Raoultella ornithinolytica]QXW32689.1 Cro/Cl family transcriptional regulator [Raoultella ornithinolytica]HAU5006424.1 Cro/Cl family transcriptional regulator [Raoultella ornithinolytica]
MAASSLSEIIKQIRVPVVAKACGRSPRAIYKWIGSGSLPRTDYTGETTYAEKIASASEGQYTAAQILEVSKPKAV